MAAHERRSWEYASQGGRSYDCSPWHFVGGFHQLVMMHPLRLLQILVKVFEIHPKIVTIVGNILKIRLDVPLEHGNCAGRGPVGHVMMQFRPIVSQVIEIFPEILQVKPNVAQVLSEILSIGVYVPNIGSHIIILGIARTNDEPADQHHTNYASKRDLHTFSSLIHTDCEW